MPSPRTLRAAAERLSRYTTEQPDAGPPTHAQGFADIYSEVHSAACNIASQARLMHAALCHDTDFHLHLIAPSAEGLHALSMSRKCPVPVHSTVWCKGFTLLPAGLLQCGTVVALAAFRGLTCSICCRCLHKTRA